MDGVVYYKTNLRIWEAKKEAMHLLLQKMDRIVEGEGYLMVEDAIDACVGWIKHYNECLEGYEA